MALCDRIKEISSITDRDYIGICSTFITLTQPKYRCFDCNRKYRTDPDRDNRNKTAMACREIVEKPRHQYKPDHNNKGNPSINYNHCIGNYYNGFFASLINYYPKWNSGILPYEGGYMEQPAKFVEIMELVHNLIKENETEQHRKQQIINKAKTSGRR